jgi:hypothetical protein
MGRRKAKTFLAALAIICLITWAYKTYTIPKLTNEENSEIISLVNSYYNYMVDKDYESALKLVDMEKADYDKAVLTLNNNKVFAVQRSLEANKWIIPVNGKSEMYYDKENKSFYTQTGTLIIDKNYNYAATENVYVKKVGKRFMITKIITDDEFGKIRGPFVKRLS